MASGAIEHGGYELDHERQGDLGQKLRGQMRECLLQPSTATVPLYSRTYPNDLGDGRFEYLFYLEDTEVQGEGVIPGMVSLLATNETMRDRIKSEFPELRRVEFEVRDRRCLAVVCTLDEMVDSAEESDDEAVKRLSRLSAEDLTKRFGMAEAAMEMKGRRLFRDLGIDGLEFESAELFDRSVVCVVRCTVGAYGAFSARMKSFGIRARANAGDPYAIVTCSVSAEIFNSGVWPKVAVVAEGVAEGVSSVVDGPSEF